MVAAVPLLTTIGGGSTALGATIVAATVASGAIAATSARAAGKVAEAQAEINSEAEGDAARGRAIERKRLLLRAISSQVAQAGATGTAFEGSPEAIARLDIDDAQNDIAVDDANTKQRQRGLKLQGRAAKHQGNLKAAGSLLDTATNVAGLL